MSVSPTEMFPDVRKALDWSEEPLPPVTSEASDESGLSESDVTLRDESEAEGSPEVSEESVEDDKTSQVAPPTSKPPLPRKHAFRFLNQDLKSRHHFDICTIP